MQGHGNLDLYPSPPHPQGRLVQPHAILTLSSKRGKPVLLLCYNSKSWHSQGQGGQCSRVSSNMSADEGAYVDSNGEMLRDARLQWGEVPTSIGEPGQFTFQRRGYLSHLPAPSLIPLTLPCPPPPPFGHFSPDWR